MTLDLETRLPHVSEQETASSAITSSSETAFAMARIALDRRRAAVRSVLLTARSEDTRVALRGLAAWYERMCVDAGYCNAPPNRGSRP